jgi:D-glycero-D-manno-heptose 1,7-bisphosphate phosphatase
VALIPGAAECLTRFRDAGWGIAVITNQAGIGRGYYGLAELEAVNRRISELLEANGASIDGFYACPHHPDAGCNCRKPRTGLVEQAAAELGFDPARTVIAGDKACDIDLAAPFGAVSILVRTGYGFEEEKNPNLRPDWVIDSLADLPALLLGAGETATDSGLRRQEEPVSA